MSRRPDRRSCVHALPGESGVGLVVRAPVQRHHPGTALARRRRAARGCPGAHAGRPAAGAAVQRRHSRLGAVARVASSRRLRLGPSRPRTACSGTYRPPDWTSRRPGRCHTQVVIGRGGTPPVCDNHPQLPRYRRHHHGLHIDFTSTSHRGALRLALKHNRDVVDQIADEHQTPPQPADRRIEVVLTHLCVEQGHRRAGIAQSLVNEVSRRYPMRLGVRAKCRDDYADIKRVWRGLGFAQLGRTRGRRRGPRRERRHRQVDRGADRGGALGRGREPKPRRPMSNCELACD
jgi:hypothetical protein